MHASSCSLRALLAMVLLAIGADAQAQRALNDSLASVAVRIGARLVEAERPRVAVTGISDPGGGMDPAMVTYVEELLVMHLTVVNGVTVVERRGLDQVMEEQRRTASGTFDEGTAIELGRLLAADAIVTGSMYRVDQQLHIILRILDTGTGILLGGAETVTDYPRDGALASRSPSMPPAGPSGQVNSTAAPPEGQLELRLGLVGYSFYDQGTNGFLAEASFRSMGSAPGRRGSVSIGLQLSYMPNRGKWADLPFDIGHVSELQVSGTHRGSILLGSTQLIENDLFLIGNNVSPSATLSPVASSGIELIDIRLYRPTNMHMGIAAFNLPLRWYFGQGRPGLPRVYAELGFGMDLLMVRADYEVTSLLLQYDPVEAEYIGSVANYTERKPMGGDVSQDIYFTHMSLGGGLEFGRFSLYLTGRYLLSTTFTANGRNYDRVRGNILALPALAGAATDTQTLFELQTLGAIRYGATDLERERPVEEDRTVTVSGNGVLRYWDERHLLLGISFRLR